jgi:NhaP-type Na+/H+ or K+/H+ antiporter
MEPHHSAPDPALTVAVALAAGLVATALARHARIPAIVLLLVAGAALGPDGLGIVQPATLGGALPTLVGFAVAVILFEGGMNLNLKRIRRESRVLRRLITVGALVTVAGAAAAARLLMGWDARFAILFGTLVVVTGPTVIGPLLRRVRLRKGLQTVLEGEGVLIDPVGAIVAVVALDVALQPSFPSVARALLGMVTGLGGGAAIGFAGGWLIALLLRPRRLIPEGLENVFALSMVLLLFHAGNSIAPESGIAIVTVAGVVVGNTRHRSLRDLMEFKEQLTVLMIGMLFVILAADVRFAELQALGWAGVATVAALMLVVRPLNVAVCTAGSELTLRERLFLGWIAPRGIVAAAVASFFALELDAAGIPGGSELRAMVFLVIAMTVTVQGLTGGIVARALGVRRDTTGYAVLGAGPLARTVARALRDGGEEVLLMDANTDAVHAAESDGFRVVFGNALEDSTMQRAGFGGLAGCLALTPNEEINLLFAKAAREDFRVPRAWVALHSRDGHVTEEMVKTAGASILFGEQKDLSLWDSCVRRGFGVTERWRFTGRGAASEGAEVEPAAGLPPEALADVLLPVARTRGGRTAPPSARPPRKGDEVTFLFFTARRDEAAAWLERTGWEPAAEREPAGAKETAEVVA